MAEFDIYRDISERCGGNLYLGVVGPVRTGKSTFIQRFMDTLILPAMTDANEKKRAADEMPQSADGKTVMTTEPKFVPENAAEVQLSENAHVKIKLIDCVGYMVEGALGAEEDGEARMVKTPWSEEPMPFIKAAEFGTRKVIEEHAGVALVVTCDGSISDLPRSAYEEAEARVIREMKAQGKPFLILLNSARADSKNAKALCDELQEKYAHPVALLDCLNLSKDDIAALIKLLLAEFPAKRIDIAMPSWVLKLPADNPLRSELIASLSLAAQEQKHLRDIETVFCAEDVRERSVSLQSIDYGTGCATLSLTLSEETFYRVLSETCGVEIRGTGELMGAVSEFVAIKRQYDKLSKALMEVEESGYGIVTPEISELHLEEPEIVRQSGGYGVKLRAWAPSIHLIRADIKTEVSPVVGSEKQSEDMVKFLLKEFEEDPQKIWDSNLFGKTLHELVGEGLSGKLAHMPADARARLASTLEKIVNEGCNGLICIIL